MHFLSASPISDTAQAVWGKTNPADNTWLPLWRHLDDTHAVALKLWDEWLPKAVRRLISADLPGGETDGRLLLGWLAGVHDIGKATPAFAYQVPVLRDAMKGQGFDFDQRTEMDRKRAPHATAGQLILRDWLESVMGWQRSASLAYTVVVGGHHGFPPSARDLTVASSRPYLLGGDVWQRVQRELLEWIADVAGVRDRFSEWGQVQLSQQAQVLLTGAVVVSDWIASNQELFPVDCATDPHRLDVAWKALDLPAPWQANASSLKREDWISERFGLQKNSRPYPVQMAAVAKAWSLPKGGMMIIEAPMGDGKTEAALAAVEILAERFKLGGCILALPTRATSDAMFTRGMRWLDRLPDADADRGAYDVVLAHGKARFNPDYEGLLYHGRTSGIGIDEGGGVDLAVHRWLAARKKVLLSSFVIGTIDQLLFMALKSRYVVLRHLGLAGKVVVIDEAHAFDVHMSQYLDRALEWLGAYGVPVIVLSATLPAQRRREMIEAHDVGRLGRLRRRGQLDPYSSLNGDIGYPVLTSSGTDRVPEVTTTVSSGRDVAVEVTRLPDDVSTLTELLRTELVAGGCALVVRNTVRRVQETAAVLREAFGDDIPVTVAHSRFMTLDRAAKDLWLRETFGPKGDRPKRHVVVASQVVEQSLDVDFDLLITDLAPVDLILQRMGRLHRHRRDRPVRLAAPRCYITGADWESTPPQPVRGSRAVYGNWALYRSAAVLWPYLTADVEVRLPEDIPRLVQDAYGDVSTGPQEWQETLTKARQEYERARTEQRAKAEVFRLGQVLPPGNTLLGWLHGSVGDADDGKDDAKGRGHVRADATESLEVIMLVRKGDGLFIPDWLKVDGTREVPTEAEPDWRQAKQIARCTIALPQVMTRGQYLDTVIAELEKRNPLPAWRQSTWLGGELVLDIDESGHARLADFDLHYDSENGLWAEQGRE